MDDALKELLGDDDKKEVIEGKKELTAEEKLAESEKENARLRKATKTLQDKVKEKETKKEEVVTDPADPLATREGWLGEIDKRAEAKTKAAIAPILDAHFNRAKSGFLAAHPEYASADNQEKLDAILNAAKSSGKSEEGELLSEMKRGWASQNYEELEKVHARQSQGRSNAQKAALKSASVGDGIKNDDDYSVEEERKAARLKMSVEDYRKARADYRRNSVNAM